MGLIINQLLIHCSLTSGVTLSKNEKTNRVFGDVKISKQAVTMK